MKLGFLLTDMSGGGGERVMLALANAFAHAGESVDLILLEDRGAFMKDITSEVNVVVLGHGNMTSALLPLVRYMQIERPHAVIATSIHMQVLLLLAQRLSFTSTRTVLRIGIPLSRRFATLTSYKDRIVKVLAKRLFVRASALIPNARGVADDAAQALNIPEDRFTVIHNPVDLAAIAAYVNEASPHQWFVERTTPVIVAVGRLRPQKDFATLIRALSCTQSDTRLILLGAGAELENLRKIARECHVGNRVEFMGFVDNPYTYMACADVFVLSSLYEGFPNALLEAMACGAPVIATDCVSGPRELLAPGSDDVAAAVERAANGILIPPKDPAHLAEAIDLLLSDEGLRTHYRTQSLQRANDFSIESIVAQYRDVLNANEK